MGRAYGTPIPQTTDGPASGPFIEWQALVRTVPGDYLFRVEAVRYSQYVDPDAERYETTAPRLELFPLQVRKWTQHGATLEEYSGCRRRWVELRPDAKQYASRTAAEAVEQFAKRRRAQIYILQAQIARAERELALTQPQVVVLPSAPPPAPLPGHHDRQAPRCDWCGVVLARAEAGLEQHKPGEPAAVVEPYRAFWLDPDWSGGDNLRDPGTRPFGSCRRNAFPTRCRRGAASSIYAARS